MKSICFYFQMHQPFRLKRYRFFDIGADHYYYDDANNEQIIKRITYNSYVNANATIMRMIKETNGAFKCAFSISGVALDQLERYCPEVIDGFKELAKTGCVEFLGETYAHSLTSLRSGNQEFERQVREHSNRIEAIFGTRPTVFRNSELIYSDEIGERVLAMGFKAMMAEGAQNVLGWKSPNYVYCSAADSRLKLLFRNTGMSEDVAYRFSNRSWGEYPLTADKLTRWISDNPQEQVVNLFMNYEVMGELQKADTGIFDFFNALPKECLAKGIGFCTPSEAVDNNRPVDQISAPFVTSWANNTKDVSPWLANKIQGEAFDKMMCIADRVRMAKDTSLLNDWYKLQSSDHLYYMSTEYYNQFFCPYDSPYDAFINFMNVYADFEKRLESCFPESLSDMELNSLEQTIIAQEKQIEELKAKVGGKGKAQGDTTSEGKSDAVESEKPVAKKPTTRKKSETKK